MAEQIVLAGKFDLQNVYGRYRVLQAIRRRIGAPPLSLSSIETDWGGFTSRDVEDELDNMQFFRTGKVIINAMNDFADPLAQIHLAEVATFSFENEEPSPLLMLEDLRMAPRTTEIISNGIFVPSHTRTNTMSPTSG